MSDLLTSNLMLRWIVTALFGVSAATYSYILVAQRGRWTSIVNQLLHLAMSLAMILMVWRGGANLPKVGTIVFFVAAGAWFACLAGRVCRDRITNSYYAVMMVAMAWMLAVMNGGLPGQNNHSPALALSGSMGMNISGTGMSAHQMSSTVAGPAWIIMTNWVVTLGFVVVALYWPCRYVVEYRTHRGRAVGVKRLEPVHQALTAAGSALMFGALL